MNKLLVIILFLFCSRMEAFAGDWPQYRADAARSGYTQEELTSELSLRWVYHPRHAPRPAWQGVDTRMPFDHAYQPVIANGNLYFGSSADCKLYALDASTGEERWTFFTGSPVRFAPALWKDRVFAVGDDGYLYCLRAVDGELLWKKRGGRGNDMILGNDRMVSRWPARGGVVIADNTVYFGAGIWPTDGIYLYALDPENGNVLWANDRSGSIEMDKPHGGARAKSGVSAQGYLAAADNNLIVPTGRSIPAVFSRDKGLFRYFHQQANRSYGGSRIMAAGPYLFADGGNSRGTDMSTGTAKIMFHAENGERVTDNEIPSTALAATPDYLIYADKEGVEGIDRDNLLYQKEWKDRNGNTVIRKYLNLSSWTIPTPAHPGGVSLIAAGDKIISGTANNKVAVLDSRSGKVVWSAGVDGRPLGLAVADGCLFVSTDRGSIYCFVPGKIPKAETVIPITVNYPFGDNAPFDVAAEEIIARSGVTDGYCLDLGCGEGRLAYELAIRTNLHIYAIDPNSDNVAAARKKLDSAGLYGVRVTVHLADPLRTPYPDYFANLVVSGRSVKGGTTALSSEEVNRILRPWGGVSCIGRPGAMEITRRGALTGADPEWSHLYHDPANTLTSSDELVKGPLEMLWFRDSDLAMPSRHGRGVGPLFSNGRLFVEGLNALRAIDAYNGHTLWEYPLRDIMKAYDQEHLVGAAATQGNLCLEGNRIYVRSGGDPTNGDFAGKSCMVLDAATGEKLAEYGIPEEPAGNENTCWGYIAVENGTLFGSIANTDHILRYAYRESDMNKLFSESSLFFAMDASTGRLKWTFAPEHSIRHNAIAIGAGKVFLIDRPLAVSDAIRRNPHRLQGGSVNISQEHPPGTLLALDCSTGEILWQNEDNIYGTLLALSEKEDVLIMTYQFTRFRQKSEVGGLVTGFRGSDGKKLWGIETGVDADQKYRYSSRPLINGRVIYLEPGAYNLLTGERLDFSFARSYNCGILTGCKNLLVFRSATVGYLELTAGSGTENYGGIRPGCWINALPVGGLVIMPDATARCNCSYLNKATIALQPLSR
jgi:outer membrane protein assembly factor BamB